MVRKPHVRHLSNKTKALHVRTLTLGVSTLFKYSNGDLDEFDQCSYFHKVQVPRSSQPVLAVLRMTTGLLVVVTFEPATV